MDMSAANWPGMPFQPSSMTYPSFQPSAQAMPGPFPLTLAMNPPTYPAGQACLPQANPNSGSGCAAGVEQRNSCSDTITASTRDEDRADSGHSNETREECLTDLEFATFIDSFLISGTQDTPQAPHTGDAALDLHLDLSDLVNDVEGGVAAPDVAVNLSVMLENMGEDAIAV